MELSPPLAFPELFYIVGSSIDSNPLSDLSVLSYLPF